MGALTKILGYCDICRKSTEFNMTYEDLDMPDFSLYGCSECKQRVLRRHQLTPKQQYRENQIPNRSNS